MSQAPVITNAPSTFATVGSFSISDGAFPSGGVVTGTDGNFYGTTQAGGGSFQGNVFKMTPGGVVTSLFVFSGTNGVTPSAGLLAAGDGNFYGTTYSGGASNQGTVFRVTASGSLTSLCSFSGTDGAQPRGSLVLGADDNLYGVTQAGGSNGNGTVYSITTSGSLTTLCSFTGTSGAAPGTGPLGRLVQGSDGNLYGTTYAGGASDQGTVYRITTDGSFASLCSFTGTSGAAPGANPYTGLMQGGDGAFYGSTAGGGTGPATLFKITSTGTLTTLYTFNHANDGNFPQGELVQGIDGNFYGTTSLGGTSNQGTVYRTTAGGAVATLYSFTHPGPDGYGPSSGMVSGTDGAFYGTTTYGGGNNAGTVYRFAPNQVVTGTSGTYSFSIAATNSPTSYTATGLPAGWTINALTGVISGKATVTGTFNITVKAINSSGTGSASFTAAVFPTPAITSSSNTTAIKDSPFSYQIVATNATMYGATGLPGGLGVNAGTGLISGTPTVTGTFGITLTASNAGASASKTLFMNVLKPPPVITSALAASGSNGRPFSYQITASNSPSSFGASGLPTGLVVSNASGLISGTPAATGTFPATISAFSSSGSGSATLSITIDPSPPVITSTLNVTGTNSKPFSYQIVAINSPTSFTATGLPAGLGVDAGTGLISGTPTVTGTFPAAIQAINATGTGSATLTITTIRPPPAITSALTASGTSGVAFSYQIAGSNTPTSYGATSLPAGLNVNTNTGLIGGTPTVSGTFSPTITATNPGGTGSATLVLDLAQARPAITTLLARGEFTGTTGAHPGSVPFAPPLQASDGNFYGTTRDGGPANMGTVYKMTPDGSLTTLCLFTGTGGANPGTNPYTGPVQGADGNFYGVTYDGGPSNNGEVYRITPSGSLTSLHAFNGLDGSGPLWGGLVSGTDGNLYGTTYTGGGSGTNNNGTVFKITTGGSFTKLYTFTGTASGANPGGLMQATDGNLYGTTSFGGSSNEGTVYRMSTSGSLTPLVSFTGTSGVHPGSDPGAALLQADDGYFYGTTYSGGTYDMGTIFRVASDGSLVTVVTFTGTNGQGPKGKLVQGSDGYIYGSTNDGGPGFTDNGTVFRVTRAGVLTTLYTGTQGGTRAFYGMIQGSNGNFFGAAGADAKTPYGEVFEFAPDTLFTRVNTPFRSQILASNNPVSFTAGGLPGGLTVDTSTGMITGTAVSSGTFNVAVSAVNSSGTGTGAFTIIVQPPTPPVITSMLTRCEFTGMLGVNPGAAPRSPLVIGSDGNFYGTTGSGGATNFGTVFRMTPSGTLTSLCTFTGTSGSSRGNSPSGGLVQGNDGNFYGATFKGGGTSNTGSVFKITLSGSMTSIYSFTFGSLNPFLAPVQGADGNFYGATQGLGSGTNRGSVFRVTPSGTLTSLVLFTGTSGAAPGTTPSGLMQAADGNMYGATLIGGTGNLGTIFRMTTSGTLTSLISFTGTAGANPGTSPNSSFLQTADGALYGVTGTGGSSNLGTIFRLDPNGSLTTLVSFTGANGSTPMGPLIRGIDGNFYGTTYRGGANGDGTLFKMTPGGALTTLYSGTLAGGAWYQGGLVQGANGNFFGTATAGGSGNSGTVFEFAPNPVTTRTDTGFRAQILATNNPASFTADGLPAGLGVDTTTGLISGTAASSGTFNVAVGAVNASGTGSGTLTIIVQPPPPVISSGTSATATTGVAFSYQITASNSPVSYLATGLPAGLGVDTVTGIISGTATTTGTFSPVIGAINVSGTGSAILSLVVQTPYSAWQSKWFTPSELLDPAITGDTATPLHDGAPNLLKYALGLDPNYRGTAGLLATGAIPLGGSNYLTLSYTQPLSATDVTCIIEVSGDLQTWNSGSDYTILVSGSTSADGTTRTIITRDKTPSDNSKRFIRLKVTRP